MDKKSDHPVYESGCQAASCHSLSLSNWSRWIRQLAKDKLPQTDTCDAFFCLLLGVLGYIDSLLFKKKKKKQTTTALFWEAKNYIGKLLCARILINWPDQASAEGMLEDSSFLKSFREAFFKRKCVWLTDEPSAACVLRGHRSTYEPG